MKSEIGSDYDTRRFVHGKIINESTRSREKIYFANLSIDASKLGLRIGYSMRWFL